MTRPRLDQPRAGVEVLDSSAPRFAHQSSVSPGSTVQPVPIGLLSWPERVCQLTWKYVGDV